MFALASGSQRVLWSPLLVFTPVFCRLDSSRRTDLAPPTSGWGNPQKTNCHWKTVDHWRPFERGVGTHANSEGVILDGKGGITAQIGVDDGENPRASVEFIVYGDDRELWRRALQARRETTRVPRLSRVSPSNWS